MNFEYSSIKSNTSTIHMLEYQEFDPFEFVNKLTSTEIERLHSFGHIKRQREFVATRILRHDLFGYEHIHYNNHGAPYIEKEGFISISHSSMIVGIAINSEYQIGMDMEPHRPNILDVKHKFLSKHESETFDCEDTMEVTKIWSAKETLYKLAGRNEIIFAKQLLLDREDSKWTGCIINPDHELKVKLDIFEDNDSVITINSEAIERV